MDLPGRAENQAKHETGPGTTRYHRSVAKKSRTPDPPRRVQAPGARAGPPRAGADRRRLMILVIAAALGLAALGVAAAVYFLTDGGSASAASKMRSAGCTLETQPGQERRHIAEPGDEFEYNTNPPTSGPHHPETAPYDVYDEPVEQTRLLHNLEHGAIVVQYGDDVTDETVARIVEWYREDPTGILIAPLPDLGGEISLGAWVTEGERPGGDELGRGVLAKCENFDAEAFDAFREEYRFRGPERFPPELLEPGAA